MHSNNGIYNDKFIKARASKTFARVKMLVLGTIIVGKGRQGISPEALNTCNNKGVFTLTVVFITQARHISDYIPSNGQDSFPLGLVVEDWSYHRTFTTAFLITKHCNRNSLVSRLAKDRPPSCKFSTCTENSMKYIHHQYHNCNNSIISRIVMSICYVYNE